MKTQTQPNLETLLPKREQFDLALSKDNFTFYDSMFSYIDQSKWEDRFTMLVRVARNSSLEKDPRPSFHKVLNGIVRMLDSEIPHLPKATELERELFLEDIAFDCNIISREQVKKYQGEISRLIENWKVGVPVRQQFGNMGILSNLYRLGYPQSLVKPTILGSFISDKVDDLQSHLNKQLIDHRRSKMDSLMIFIEHLQAKTVTHLCNGDVLFLHKGDINWEEIATARITIDDYDWYSRKYEDTSLLEDWYSNPFGIHFYPSFQMDYVLYKLCKLYGVQLSDYVSDVSQYYAHLWLFDDKDSDDSTFSLSEIYPQCLKHWKEKYPLLSK